MRDLEIVRGSMGDPGFRELAELHFVERRFLAGLNPNNLCDYRASELGRAQIARHDRLELW